MAENVQDATLEIMRRIQESISQLRSDMDQRFEKLTSDVSRQVNIFAEEARKDRRNINGLMAIVQSVAGDFDERIRGVDDRVSILDDRAS